VAEHHLAEPVDGQRHRVRQARQPVDVIGAELLGRPRRYGVANVIDLAAGELDQLPVRVAAHPDHLVAQAEQPVKHLCRLRACRDVPVSTIRSARCRSGSASTASSAGMTPWMSDRTATELTIVSACQNSSRRAVRRC
jgi:hypothetical protein